MPSSRSSNDDAIDKAFADLEEFYPGSRSRRRSLTEAEIKRKHSDTTWDSRPFLKRLPNGDEVEMFTLGSLATALGRPLVTLRLWERKGYIPSAPYRLKEAVIQGTRVPGRRLYTRALIEAAVEAFNRRHLLGKARIDWSRHQDLSIELYETWTQIHAQETAL